MSDLLFVGGGEPWREPAAPTARPKRRKAKSRPKGQGWAAAWTVRPDLIQREFNFDQTKRGKMLCESISVDPSGMYVCFRGRWGVFD